MSSHMHRAYAAFEALLTALGQGSHHLTCCAEGADGQMVVACLQVEVDRTEPGPPTASAPVDDARVFTILLAAAMATGGGLVSRTYRTNGGSVVRGWKTQDGWPLPLTEAEVFSAFCTDALTGDPISPEPDTSYQPGIPLVTRT
ncbi:hypothetical protein [Streptomyces sp. NPDC001970]